MPVLYAAAALLGLAVGSFLNVVIHRVPAGQSLVHPGSKCPSCDSAIRARHNIPLVGWVVLRGRCADCAAPISVRYPLVEALTAALFVATTAQAAHLDLLPALPAYLFFVAIGIALAAIDLTTFRLPNAIIYPAYAVLAQLLTIASVLEGSATPLLRALAGAVLMLLAYFAILMANPHGIGFGDVKLAGVIGAALGFLSWSALLVGACAAFVVGGVVAAVLLSVRRIGRRSLLPFGPAMVGGAFIALFAAAPLAHAYSRLVTGA